MPLLFKESVHEPFAGLGDAEEPETAAGLVLGIEIIAGFVVAFPPDACDALGADGVRDSMNAARTGE